MINLAIHLVALFALTWFGTSLLASAAVWLLDARLLGLEPRARFRLILVALIAPLAVGGLVVLGVAFPHQWLGLGDHCLDHPGHLHLCFVHGAPTPPLFVVGFAGLAVAWSGQRLARATAHTWLGARALRRVVDAARLEGQLRVLPGRTPVAFTVGLLRPFVVVTESVVSNRERWGAVIEHERAHVAGRDPLVRWFAEILTAFHAPRCGEDLASRLRGAQELAADERAARAVGCRVEVAQTLIEWMRWSHAARDAGVGFDSGPFALRVLRLLDPGAYRSGPSTLELLAVAGVFVGASSLSAVPLHHAVETVLGLLLS